MACVTSGSMPARDRVRPPGERPHEDLAVAADADEPRAAGAGDRETEQQERGSAVHREGGERLDPPAGHVAR